MNEIFGIEMSNHTAFAICAVLTLISSALCFIGGFMMNYYDNKKRYDLSIIGSYLIIFGGLGVVVFSMIGGCFRDS